MSVEGDEKIEIIVEIGWQFLAIVATLIVALVVVWVSGGFYEFLFTFSPLLRPVELSLSGESFPPDGIIEIKVCVAEWLRTDELSLWVISPEGAPVYSGGIRAGSDGCMTVSVTLRGGMEGVYTVAVIRRSSALFVARFRVTGYPL